eukprot:CAMPEP_0176354296 /NCGR_PEP_ID=MMETSP0126-20121128/12449_1 /TAXON_ID=141414 ORGANISM="Strombidinopsis acuminatum, Strain SPMC142" /NCGR_SAMPLE_ID=MMETSP0126 /ASSEMBLY_ACC=CAM_ASM_000229 /LENGTH=67 /DNA_ID=CAMNT_0017706397 /DNA_START=741 /DNA_END=941 /DNA_ORIENTATION=-
MIAIEVITTIGIDLATVTVETKDAVLHILAGNIVTGLQLVRARVAGPLIKMIRGKTGMTDTTIGIKA